MSCEASHILGQEKFLASDFDKTLADTSRPAPDGTTVETAYEYAIEKVAGRAALDLYRATDGLRNRAPVEIIQQLFPDLDDDERNQKAEDLITVKLQPLYRQAGQRLPDGGFWPAPMPGAAEVWRVASDAKHIGTGVISSGHTPFIERFFEIHELTLPDAMITDDDMRPLMKYLPAELCVKPSRLLFDMLQQKLHERKNLPTDYVSILTMRDSTVIVGDDVKDIQLALNAGVHSALIDTKNAILGWRSAAEFLGITPYVKGAHAA